MIKILFIDTLTTGMNADRCAIYRIGGIYTEDGVEKRAFDFKVRPYINARINDTSIWLGGESRSSLIDLPEEKEVFAQFIEFLDGCVNVKDADDKLYIGGFNCGCFDIPFLEEWFKRNGNTQYRNYFHVQCYDMMNVAVMALAAKRQEMPAFTQDCVAKALGIETIPEEKYQCILNARLSLKIWRDLNRRFGLIETEDSSETENVTKNF